MGKEVDLNNLLYNLPDNEWPLVSGQPQIKPGFYRMHAERLGIMDLKIGEYLRRGGQDLTAGHSEKYKGQTFREFFQTMDQVVAELDLGAEIGRLKGSRNWREFNKKMQPLAKRLLEMGYNLVDFTK